MSRRSLHLFDIFDFYVCPLLLAFCLCRVRLMKRVKRAIVSCRFLAVGKGSDDHPPYVYAKDI